MSIRVTIRSHLPFFSSILNILNRPEDRLRQLIPSEERGMAAGSVTEQAYNMGVEIEPKR